MQATSGLPQAEGVHNLQETNILAIILQHAQSQLQTREVCALLCTDTATAALVKDQFHGILDVTYSPRSGRLLKSLVSWFRAHGSMLRSLEYNIFVEPHWRGMIRWSYQEIRAALDAEYKTASACLGSGLNAAAAAGLLPHLRAFTCWCRFAATPDLLQGLPAFLTKLDLIWDSSKLRKLQYPDPLADLEAGLARLAGLNSLHLCSTSHLQMDLAPAAIGVLTALTDLNLDGFSLDSELVQQLPPSLLQLRTNTKWNGPKLLGHLTALTSLDTGNSYWWPDSIAPPNPLRLRDRGTVPNTALLKQLTRLQHIDWVLPSTAVVEIGAGLSCLTFVGQLAHTCVSTEEGGTAHAASPGRIISGLQLRSADGPAGAADVWEATGAAEGAAERADGGLARVVDVLKACGTAAAIRGVYVDVPSSAPIRDDAAPVLGEPVVSALARLPKLESLQFEGLGLSTAAVAAISRLSALTALTLGGCEVGAEALPSLASALTQLPCLQELYLPRCIGDTGTWVAIAVLFRG